jgi:hypothetical protein
VHPKSIIALSECAQQGCFQDFLAQGLTCTILVHIDGLISRVQPEALRPVPLPRVLGLQPRTADAGSALYSRAL